MKKILIFDSDMGIRMLLSEELTENSYYVVESYKIGNLFPHIERAKPDLVVTEMNPWNHRVINYIREIRAHFGNLPMILWTAYSIFSNAAQSVKFDYCLTKSSKLGELKSRIYMALNNNSA